MHLHINTILKVGSMVPQSLGLVFTRFLAILQRLQLVLMVNSSILMMRFKTSKNLIRTIIYFHGCHPQLMIV